MGDSCNCFFYLCVFKFLYRMRERVGLKVVKAMKRNDDGVTHAAIDMLGALMQVRGTATVHLIMSLFG